MLEFEAYKTYHAYATGEKILKPKYVKNKVDYVSSPMRKSAQASKGKRIKTSTKVAKPVKKKQPATTSKKIGLNVLSEIKLATKRSLIQTHSSHASGSGVDEGTGVVPGVLDVPTYNFDDEHISWKSSDEEDDNEVHVSKDDDYQNDDDDDNQNNDDADNEDDDNQNDKDADNEDDDDQNDDNADNEGDDDQDDDNEQTKSDNDDDDLVNPKLSTFDENERQDEEDKEEEWSDDEAYDDETKGVNVEGEELDEEQTNEEEEANELSRDVNVNLEGRDTKMIDASQTNIQGTQVREDTHVIITAATPEGIDSILNLNTESTSLVDVPVSTNVEMPPSSVTPLPPPLISFIQPQQQTLVPTPTIVPSTSLQNLPTFAVSSIPSIVDTYLANKMDEAVKTAVQLQSDKLRDEAQAENEDFINTLNENMRKIIKTQVKEQVKEQVSKILPKIEKFVKDKLKAEVLTRSSNQAKTSYVVAANLSELELKKILIDKIESNKSIDRSIQQKTLYNALVDANETDKVILETYGDTLMFKRRRDDKDEDEEPFAGSNRGSKRRRAGKEPESTIEEPIHTDKDLEEPVHQEFDTGFTKDQAVDETTQHPDCTLARNEDLRESFNELMDTPLDFSVFVMNQLKVDTLTPELLAGLTYELMKGSGKSLVELEYFLEEVCKATTDQLDWNNPEGQQYPHDLRKPLPLIPNSRGRRVIPFDHFINNDLAHLSGGVSSQTYATSVTKTKAADYRHIKWIEDFVPNLIILTVIKLKIVEWHNYKHLDWITVRRNDDKLYTFKEGDYNRLRLQDIEDMLLLLVQGKLTNLNVEERIALGVSLQMFTRSVVLRRRVEDLQLGVESYQKKLNLTRPDTYRSDLK
ncbi:hypothetical protein Tco_0812467 [Tanacetum coccineum]